MKNKQLNEALRRLKQETNGPEAALLIDSGNRLKLTAAWLRVRPVLVGELEVDIPARLDDLIALLWSLCDYDMGRWARLAGMNPTLAEREAQALIEAGLIYPDGTVSEYAAKLINARVLAAFPKRK